jgi:hypothetical protein
MNEPGRDDATPPTTADPTRPVQPPPLPGRAVREQLARGELATPPIRPDEATVHIDGPARTDPQRTLELDGTLRTGAVLLVMLWRGATIEGDVQFLGAHLRVDGDLVGWAGRTVPR